MPVKPAVTVKFQSSSPIGCKNLQKLTSLIFPSNDFGEFSLCAPLYDHLSHLSLDQKPSPLHSTHDPFLLQTLSECGLLSSSSFGVCSVILKVYFLGIHNDLIII